MFTIIIPAYKSKYLSEAIESVLAQTDSDFELIIVNDHSPEDLTCIVGRYKDLRIRYYINEKNYGAECLVNNWNKCLEYAQGEFVICMGDDDKLKPCCLAEYRRLINEYPNLDVYHGWTELIDEHSKSFSIQEKRPKHESVYMMMTERWKGRCQFIGDFLYRTQALRNNGGYYFLPLAWASDDITAYIVAAEKGIANTEIPVFQYRDNSLTISNNGRGRTKIEAIQKEKEWTRCFLEKIPDNDIDLIYHNYLQEEFHHHFQYKIQSMIIKELGSNSLIQWFYWFFQRKRLGLSIPIMLWILISSFKDKIKRS